MPSLQLPLEFLIFFFFSVLSYGSDGMVIIVSVSVTNFFFIICVCSG